ncbi:polysaccharide deacetylase family protein [Petrocella sp. FN5]|uniref:polysaccharide deacetylase family protein n=1 Tax=Petrocella sp. FN5 TaxID=3032002 RepID=UPI0023DCC06B|nr:polysaccharide deacetylase family protein [Petrocella sp. FN5]MDF1616701.1 polysaccharide deacetylase family protein [Petrocella sp. FN5]
MKGIVMKLLFALWIIMVFSSCSTKVDQEDVQADEIDAQSQILDNQNLGITTEPTTEPDEGTDSQEEDLTQVPIDYKSLGVNEIGDIMVVMYHGIMDNPPYHRSKEDFIRDLQYFYDNNYYLISMKEYLSQQIDAPLGKTPIVLTFDDGLASTFALIENEVDPESAIGILEEFVQEHNDFGKAATLFIHATNQNFKGDGDALQRLEWLIENGYEIGNHSATHADLSKLSKDALIKEIGQVDYFLKALIPDYNMLAITYPYGKRPEASLIQYLSHGQYEDVEFGYEVGFREGPSSKMVPPSHIKFDPYNAPRVRGSEGDVQDLWWFLDYYEKNADERYISDGNANTIVVPKEKVDLVNNDKVMDMELIVYE